MKNQNGFGAIMAIVVLVILASLSAAMLNFSSTQTATYTQDVLSGRAWLAAKSGTEWGLYQALQPGGLWYWNPATYLPSPAPCSAASPVPKAQTLDLSADTGFWVTVTCGMQTYNEGETSSGINQTAVITIDAVACNSSAGCPDATKATTPNYVERRRRVTATANASE